MLSQAHSTGTTAGSTATNKTTIGPGAASGTTGTAAPTSKTTGTSGTGDGTGVSGAVAGVEQKLASKAAGGHGAALCF